MNNSTFDTTAQRTARTQIMDAMEFNGSYGMGNVAHKVQDHINNLIAFFTDNPDITDVETIVNEYVERFV